MSQSQPLTLDALQTDREPPLQTFERSHCAAPSPREQIQSAIVPRNPHYILVKTVIEFAAACLLLIPAVPVVLLTGLIIKCTSRGPMFYVQTRVGLHGRSFRLYKLRTMRVDAEARSGPVWSTANDPRVTPFGRFLRATHIDEFPQLLNVLLGQMSLVGPRPERPEFVSRLQWELSHYCDRLNVKPGVTGLAQLCLPPDTCIESVRRKLIYDLYYVRRMSPWFDARLIAHTAFRLVRNSLRFAVRQTGGLPSQTAIHNELVALVGCGSSLLVERRVDEL